MSYIRSYHHIVFVTKHRANTLTQEHCEDLYNYIGALVKKRDSHLYDVNGIEDHIHLLVRIHPTIALSEFVKEIKVATSIWLKANEKFPLFIGWSPKYAAFTKSQRDFEIIRNYIRKQKTHHAGRDLLSEMDEILREEMVDYDPKYFFE